MSPIVPALIPTSFSHIAETLSTVSLFTHEIQIDIVDGVFVPFTSWPYTGGSVSDIRQFTTQFQIEVDLMVEKPEGVLSEFLKAGVRQAVVHLESVTDLATILELKQQFEGVKIGFSILNDTPLSVLTDVIDSADYVQLMGIAHIGSQGQPFDERVLERIRTLKTAYPKLRVSIDGSVNIETVGRLAHAGADRCVSGSAVLKHAHPDEAFNSLTSLFLISA